MGKSLIAMGIFTAAFLATTVLPHGKGELKNHRDISAGEGVHSTLPLADPPNIDTVHLLAVGDVNLGRDVGQRILEGDTLFPFEFVAKTFAQHDVVFANLESTLSDQRGETQHPHNNLIFTGPPAGAFSLKKGMVTLVSTANNHALDYGLKSLTETIGHLQNAGIAHAGTSPDGTKLWDPVILERHHIRIALFACTDVMNMEDPFWKKYVAAADTGKLLPRIRKYRDSVDFIIISFHGGGEYADRPTPGTMKFAHAALMSGADLFLGHHPHVPYGLEELSGKYILYSLGNFVFRQPLNYWTEHSFAFSAVIVKKYDVAKITQFRILPVRSGLQPRFITTNPDSSIILERLRKLSPKEIAERIQE